MAHSGDGRYAWSLIARNSLGRLKLTAVDHLLEKVDH
jgi:hypothetical protein